MFTTINGASATDPRVGGRGGSRKQWYVTFDGDASAWVAGSTDFYKTGNYLVVMADAQNVAPAIDGHNPAPRAATYGVTVPLPPGFFVMPQVSRR
jgi:hypothetical protein